MNSYFKLATAIVFSFAMTAPAWALNPQPEPPGRHKVVTTNNAMTGHTTAHATGAANADVDDNYCGTPVPGHPHIGTKCATVHTNAMGGAMTGHANIAVHATGHGSAADVDDNYCGTPVPGHPHVGANCPASINAKGGAAGHTTNATH